MTDTFDRDIDRLFSEGLLPLAARMKSAGARLLETQIEEGASSYFVRRPHVEMTKLDFEVGGCVSPATIESDLGRLWNRPDDRSLATLVPEIARLAQKLRQAQEQTAEVSSFVYVMY